MVVGGGGGGASAGGIGAGGINEDGCYIGGGGSGGGASYIDTSDTSAAVATVGSGAGAGGPAGAGMADGTGGASGQITFTYTLGVPPTISTTQTSASFTGSQAGTFSFAAKGTPTPNWSESGALPAGVTFTDDGDGDATLAGTATQQGTYAITVTAANGESPAASESFVLYVDAPPVITSTQSSALVIEGSSMSQVAFTATGTPTPTWSTSGLPSGVTLSSDGVLSGTEPVKASETDTQDFFCTSFSTAGLLIHATVGSLGGIGRRPQNR